MIKRITSILLMACLCMIALTGCKSDAPAPAAAGTTSGSQTAQESGQKILGIVADADMLNTDEEALYSACGVNYSDYSWREWYTSDIETVADDATQLVDVAGCETIIFAVTGSAQIADQFSLDHPDIQVVIADIARTTDAVEVDTPTVAPSLDDGIIVVSESVGRAYTYKSTGGVKCNAFTVNIDKIDPETGSVTHIRTFSNEDTYSCSAYLRDIGGNTANAMRSFNPDMTLITATVRCESGAEHIGWVDENGNFIDVSEKITVESDFGALTIHRHPCFFENYIYFRDCTNTKIQIKRVPMDNLTADAVEIMVDGTNWNGVDIWLLSDGTAIDTADGYEYYDSSMQYPARAGLFYDWVSADVCVGNWFGTHGNDIIYKYQLSGEEDIWDWYSEKTTFIPSVKDRRNWNAVVSPNGDQVAFLSQLTSGTDQSTSLFLISIDGGEPTKVNTDYMFNADKCGMIDWR